MKGGLEPFFVAYVPNSLVFKVRVVRRVGDLLSIAIFFDKQSQAFHSCVRTEYFAIKVRIVRVGIDYSQEIFKKVDSNFSRLPTYQISCNKSPCSSGSRLIISRYFLLKADSSLSRLPTFPILRYQSPRIQGLEIDYPQVSFLKSRLKPFTTVYVTNTL